MKDPLQDVLREPHEGLALLAGYNKITSDLGLHALVRATLKFLLRNFSIKACSIAILNSDKKNVHVFDTRNTDHTGWIPGIHPPEHAAVLSEVIQRKTPRYRADISFEPLHTVADEELLAEGVRSDFLLPLWLGNTCLGTLNAGASHINGFSEKDRHLLTLLMPFLAQALWNAKRFETLQKSEQRYRALAEAAPVGIFRADAYGRYTYVNDKWCAMAGLTLEESLGLEWSHNLHPDDRERVLKQWREALSAHTPFQAEYRFKDKSHTEIWVLGQTTPEIGQNGEILGHVGTITDITPQTEIGERLKESQRILSTLMDNLPGMVYRCQNDKNWSLIFANSACLQLIGCPAEDLISGKIHYVNFIHPDDRDHVWGNVQKALNKKEPFTLHYRLVTSDGQEKWVREQGRGIYSEQGILLFLEGFISDITQQHKAERHNRILEEISQASLRAGHHEPMLNEVLQSVLNEFGCDRVWLIYPCTPEEKTYRIIKEMTHPEWPGAHVKTPVMPMTPVMNHVFRNALKVNRALPYDSKSGWVRENSPEALQFHIQSMMHMAITPKIGKPWLFGIHHCAKAHVFDKDEVRLFTDIGHRITEALSSLLSIQELHNKESRLADAQRIAHVGNWELDLFFNVLTWSDEIYRILGKRPQTFEPTYEAFLKTVHPDDREFVHRSYSESVGGREPYNIVHRLLLKDGSVKYVNERCETIYNLSGEAVRSVGTIQDITEQKLTEDTLRRSAVIVDNTADAITITDEHNRIIEINRAFTEITGYSRDEVLNKNPSIIKSGKHTQSFYTEMWADIVNKGMWQGELWNRRKNGELFPAWETITTVRDSEGKVVNYVSIFSDISTIKRSQENLDFLAHHDPLTQLPNRILFNDRLDHALRRAQRENTELALIFLDLDRFKNINDSLGHPLGDLVLKLAAQRIQETLRENDTVARLGGDEFVIIIEESTRAVHVAVLAQKLIMTFKTPFSVQGHELHLGVSMGISLYPKDGKDSETLIRNADAAMYRAKEEGRNNFQFYTNALTLAAFERLTLETELHHALEEQELVLHYQPQYSLKTGQVTNVEVLVRWNHPKLGLIFPEKFVPLAEESGLILSIGEWVLETACAQMQRWLGNGTALTRVAINVSGVQFQRGDIVKTIVRILKKTGLSPSRLEIEITESAIMHRIEHVIQVLSELTRMGVSISIDDFGTGYSSLNYLKRLPINRLKIDKSFVRDIPHDANDVAITRAVNALGQSLQVGVIAEGVETEAQRQFLTSLGCNEAQGYLYSRPLAADACAAFLARR